MNYFQNNNMLFVLANQGAGGHRLGRIISCFDNVYWYSSKNNGIDPWDLFFNRTVTGKSISQYHYDRTIGSQTLPIVGERILKWWDPSDYNNFYNNVWAEELNKLSLPNNMIIHWVLHDTPQALHKIFPQAKIISLIDTDMESVTARYMQTTAKFPCAINHFNLKPAYKNAYAIKIAELGNPTEQEFWFYLNSGATQQEYFNHIKENLTLLNNARQSYFHKNYLSLTWETIDINVIKSFLNSNNIDQRYLNLL